MYIVCPTGYQYNKHLLKPIAINGVNILIFYYTAMLSAEDNEDDPFAYQEEPNMKKLKDSPHSRIFSIDKTIVTVTFHHGQKQKQDKDQFVDNKDTFNFKTMFDYVKEHQKRLTEGRYDDSHLNFSEYPLESLDCTETRDILVGLNFDNERSQPSEIQKEKEEDMQKKQEKFVEMDNSALSGPIFPKDSSWSKSRGKIYHSFEEEVEVKQNKGYQILLQEDADEDDGDETIFELSEHFFKSLDLSVNLEDLLKDDDEEEETQKISNKEKMEEFLNNLVERPMNKLRIMMRYQNCRKVSIKAIYSPINDITCMRTRVLEEKTHLKIDNKKITLRGTLTQPQAWLLGESRIVIRPAICSLRCYTCGTKINKVCEHEGMFRILCSNKSCMKEIIFQITDISLI